MRIAHTLKIVIITIFILLLLVVTIFLFLLSKGPSMNSYGSEYPELFTEANNSMILLSSPGQDTVKVLEHDEYGRMLYSYTTAFGNDLKNIRSGSTVTGIFICQMAKDGDVYYYPDRNFFLTDDNAVVDESSIAELKEENDWNEAMDLGKCQRLKISDSKEIPSDIVGDADLIAENMLKDTEESASLGNKHSPTVIVAAITGKVGVKDNMPTHYYIGAENGLQQHSIVLLEQLRTIDKRRLDTYIGRLDTKHIAGLNHALAISVDLINFIPGALIMCLCPVCEKHFRDAGIYHLQRIEPEQTEKCTYCNERIGNDFVVITKKS